MEISDTWAPLMLTCVRDAIILNEQRMQSETLRDRHEYEEHEMQLHIFLDYLKEEYRLIEGKVGMPLATLFPSKQAGADILPFAPPA